MICAELTIIPIGTGQTSLSKYVAAAVSALKETGIKYELSGMGTLLESEDPDELFSAIKSAHEAVFKVGALRAATSVKIDDRRDKDKGLNEKVKSVEDKI
ncbi:MAG TPA: MTH1187 family thiamine-binding protein [Methanobacteriaceae archaeon]|nr:MTH1187 family thiamine-binding protein [Methanobacteriaceae archaeon]